MTISVKTNQSALTVLQSLNKTTDQITEAQNRVSSGLKIGQSKDNASLYAIAQGQRASLSALGAVTDSLNRALSISDVAASAGDTISDLLNSLKEKVLAATEPTLDPTTRTLLNNDYRSLLNQVAKVVQSAVFDGVNILDGSVTGLKFLASADATSYLSLTAQNMSLGGTILTLPATSSINTATNASVVLPLIEASIVNVNSALTALGAQAKQIEAHNKFVDKFKDTLTAGVGAMVDADLAKESARLQALQVQQQLGAQSLSIANQTPQIILSLFRS